MSKTLTVYLAADVSKLNSGLTKGQRGLKDFEDGSSSLGSKLSGMVGPAMIGAAAAAGAFAVSLAVDGVKAALEDEKAVAKLSTTMNNLGFPEQTANVLSFIDGLQRASGVSEDMLRPAFERLAIATGDVGLAQTNLQLAMDISAGTGKSLEAVANALGKAYEGNTGALGKLGTGIDKAVLKTGDMDAITKQLGDTFRGQAAASAETFGGKMARLSVAFDELKESFGTGFLEGISSASGGVDDLTTQMAALEPKLKLIGQMTGEGVVGMLDLAASVVVLYDAMSKLTENNAFFGFVAKVTDSLNPLSKAAAALKNVASWFSGEDEWQRAGATAADMAASIDYTAKATTKLTPTIHGLTDAQKKAAEVNKLLQDRYEATLDIFNSAKSVLGGATRELQKWNDEIDSFITTTAGKITSGIDIGAAFDKATSEAGKAAGLTTVKAFQDQLTQSLKFGNSLQKLKSSGAEDNLIQQVASVGPEAGVALVDELVQSGMIPEIQAQLNDVEASAKWLAGALVPPFLIEGQNAARGAVVSALIEFQSAQSMLEDAGKAIGKSLGKGMLDEIKKAIKEAQEALQNMQGGKTYVAATGQDYTAPGGAQMGFQEANFFDIAAYNSNSAYLNAGQDIGRVILQSNNRNGWWETPTITPVLG